LRAISLYTSAFISEAIRNSVFKNLNSTRKELQAQKTLTIVLVFFVLSYFPLFTHITAMSFIETFNSMLNNATIALNEANSSMISPAQNTSFLTSIGTNVKLSNYICLILVPDNQYKSSFFLNVFEQQDVDESKQDIIFYSFTWLAYSSAMINPVLHLLLNQNFKTALISCFKKGQSRTSFASQRKQ
jgi:hypothetical protein